MSRRQIDAAAASALERRRERIERQIEPEVERFVRHHLSRDAEWNRAELAANPAWQETLTKAWEAGVLDELWHSEADYRWQGRMIALERRVDAGETLHPSQLREVLELRRRHARGRRSVASDRRFANTPGWRPSDIEHFVHQAEVEYSVAARRWRSLCHELYVGLTVRRGEYRPRGAARPRARRARARVRGPSDDDGDGSSEPPGVAGRRDPLYARPASAIGAGAGC